MMDRRSWPWKKKSSEKVLAAADFVSASLSSSTKPQTEQDDAKSEKYVQIAVESYIHLSGLEDMMKTLNEKLLSAQSEMTIKDNLVKQHAKVAEEAVSGWEKAEAEALAVKQQLENVTLQKLTAEERSSHLDGAIKECMKQLRNVKEESEIKLHDVVFAKKKQWEIVRADLEAKLIDFEQELLKASADNSILSRSLQDRSNLLMKVNEEKYQTDAQIEVLKNNVQSCEKEISSMEYELHVVTKELEVRNEEKNMSMRSAEVANKQHSEDIKKITKLEAECQRLRVLVRKKLPGPAALAQMKIEVENLGREYGNNRLRWSPVKGCNAQHASPFDFTVENMQQVQKENEFLTARILAMDEEMKMLNEALSSRNSELQASRKICAKHANKLRNMEAHLVPLNQHKSHSKFSTAIHFENESKPPSLTSVSEDGIDEEMSYSGSWATSLITELSPNKKEKDVAKNNKKDDSHYLELMDDFLEMERLARLSTETDKDLNRSDNVKLVKGDDTNPMDRCFKMGDAKEQKIADPELLPNSTAKHASKKEYIQLLKLKSRIISTFESYVHENSMEKILNEFGHIIWDVREELPQNSFVREVNGFSEEISDQSCQQEVREIIDVGVSSKNIGSSCTKFNNASDQDLKNAIAYIHGFLASLCKEDAEIQANSSTGIIGKLKKIEEFSTYIDRGIYNKITLHDFVLDLAYILCETCKFKFLLGAPKGSGESNCADFIDEETLLENQVTHHEAMNESLSGALSLVTHSSSFSDVEGSLGSGFRIKTTPPTISLVDFENLKLEKEKVQLDLYNCKEMLNQTKSALVEVDQQLSEFKSELVSCQKSNSLAETQLKCMAESYKLLESRKEELEAEVGHWRAKAETLDNELQLEKLTHQEDIVKYNELQEQIERNRKCSTCSFPSDTNNAKTQQEREIAAAADKLAECQETINLLGQQLHEMRNLEEQTDFSPIINRPPLVDAISKDGRNSGSLIRPRGLFFSPLHPDQPILTSATEQSRRGSPLNGCKSHMNSSDTEQTPFSKSPITSRHRKHKVCRSSSSPSLPSNAMPEKHGRGFRKLFSRGKGEC